MLRNLIDRDHKSIFSNFSWYFQENERDRLWICELELIALFMTSQQAIKYNNSHKWLNWVTKTKIKFYLIHSHFLTCYWNVQETILCHSRQGNAHTSKIVWPRCTKVKHVFWITYLCLLPKHCAIIYIVSNFLLSIDWSNYNTREQTRLIAHASSSTLVIFLLQEELGPIKTKHHNIG